MDSKQDATPIHLRCLVWVCSVKPTHVMRMFTLFVFLCTTVTTSYKNSQPNVYDAICVFDRKSVNHPYREILSLRSALSWPEMRIYFVTSINLVQTWRNGAFHYFKKWKQTQESRRKVERINYKLISLSSLFRHKFFQHVHLMSLWERWKNSRRYENLWILLPQTPKNTFAWVWCGSNIDFFHKSTS